MWSTLSLAILLAAGTAGADSCEPGVYGTGAESAVLYRPAPERELRYVLVDGRRGAVGGDGAAVYCEGGQPYINDHGPLERQALRETDTRFSSGELTLAGRLIEPPGEDSQRPLLVFVHGSEHTAAVGASPYPYLFAAQGVSAFVFDKRGTGASEGQYTQDFHALAGDVVAAAREAKRLAEGRHSRFGLFGGSQGGWVAPLAAQATDAEFVVVGFGLVLSPAEEDAEQVYDELRRMGYSEAVLDRARDVTDATATLVASHFTDGFEALEAVKRKYGREPWFDSIEGEYTGPLLRATESELRSGSPAGFEDLEVPWRHDAVKVLRELRMPQLWVLAAEDRVAPGLLTQQRLAELQCDGYPVATATFPATDHGIIEFEEDAEGTRRYTRFAEGYFRLIADYAKEELEASYGRAGITMPPGTPKDCCGNSR